MRDYLPSFSPRRGASKPTSTSPGACTETECIRNPCAVPLPLQAIPMAQAFAVVHELQKRHNEAFARIDIATIDEVASARGRKRRLRTEERPLGPLDEGLVVGKIQKIRAIEVQPRARIDDEAVDDARLASIKTQMRKPAVRPQCHGLRRALRRFRVDLD